MSTLGHLIEHQACVYRGCEERKQHSSEGEKGRRWMERADVMQPLSAITLVLCCRFTVCCMTDYQIYILTGLTYTFSNPFRFFFCFCFFSLVFD